MRLIGGNISDTPVKEVGDGSAFNVGGGGGGAAALLTLGSFSSASTATGWDSIAPFATFGANHPGNVAHCYLADDIAVYVWRSSADNKVKASVVTFDSNGDPTSGTEQDLSDFTTSANAPVMVERVSDSRVIICNTINTSVQTFEVRAYDISGSTFTGGDAKQTISASATTYAYNHQFITMHVVNADVMILTIGDYYRLTNANGAMYSIKFTATQSVNSVVGTGEDINNGHGMMWGDPTFTDQDSCFIGTGSGILELALSAAVPPVVSIGTDHGSVSGGSFISGTSSIGHKTQGVVYPDTIADHGEVFMHTPATGIGYWSGGTDNVSQTFGHPYGMDGNSTASHLDTRLVYIDKSGDDHRFIMISPTATHIRAVAVNINTTLGTITKGRAVSTTNITRHGSGYLFGASRPKAGASKITIICQDDASTVKYLTLAFSG